MSLPAFIFKQIASNSPATAIAKTINDLNTNLNQIFTSILKKQQLDSVILQNITLVVGSNQIPHTLGKMLTGWQIIRQSSASQIYDTGVTNQYLTLNASAPTTLSLLVF